MLPVHTQTVHIFLGMCTWMYCDCPIMDSAVRIFFLTDCLYEHSQGLPHFKFNFGFVPVMSTCNIKVHAVLQSGFQMPMKKIQTKFFPFLFWIQAKYAKMCAKL